MEITLDQARALDAVIRHGSYAKAALALHKVHSAVIYQVRALEAQVGLPLFDRSGYRSVPTPLGRRVHEQCLKILAATCELAALCEVARTGHEPYLRVVFDGLLPVAPILTALRKVAVVSPGTRLTLFSEFLSEVEARAESEAAEIMLTVVPATRAIGPELPLPPLPSLLVAHKEHPLAKLARVSAADLEAHTFLTVRGSDQRLAMSTTPLDKQDQFRLGDFHAKRVALLAGMGWGWMPEYLIGDDLRKGRLVVLRFGRTRGRHVFHPTMHLRRESAEGRATQAFARFFDSAEPALTTRGRRPRDGGRRHPAGN